nr:E3 ubiquitin-protein ligase UPL1 [Ipomoea batatas]
MVSLGSVPEMDFANLLIVADFKDSAANTVTSNQTMVFELYNDRFHGLMNTQGSNYGLLLALPDFKVDARAPRGRQPYLRYNLHTPVIEIVTNITNIGLKPEFVTSPTDAPSCSIHVPMEAGTEDNPFLEGPSNDDSRRNDQHQENDIFHFQELFLG